MLRPIFFSLRSAFLFSSPFGWTIQAPWIDWLGSVSTPVSASCFSLLLCPWHRKCVWRLPPAVVFARPVCDYKSTRRREKGLRALTQGLVMAAAGS